jgi:hypothetical protein
MDQHSVESVAARIAAVDPRGGTLEVAGTLPRIFKELVAVLGPAEAGRRFDEALTAVIDAA